MEQKSKRDPGGAALAIRSTVDFVLHLQAQPIENEYFHWTLCVVPSIVSPPIRDMVQCYQITKIR